MAIRNTCKMLLVNDNKILLSIGQTPKGEIYYEFPGGGQNQYETLEDAVRRESLEETGYPVEVIRLVAIHEEIFDVEAVRQKHPDFARHAHRLFFLFLCRIDGERQAATGVDQNQIGCEWIALSDIDSLTVRPPALKKALTEMLNSDHPLLIEPHRIQPV